MRNKRRLAVVALLALAASLLGAVAPTAAGAAESIPDLQWPAADVGQYYGAGVVTGPEGSTTLPCDSTQETDLRTYNSSGQLIRSIPRTPKIDGVENCIDFPSVDKNGDLYGTPYGQTSGGAWKHGPNLLAYDGNTLKWKFPVPCGSYGSAYSAVGADGNIYAIMRKSDGNHLIGVTPEVTPPATQPTKVFDVIVANDCGTELHAYKDGIMLDDGDNPRFYSYSGTYLGQAPIGDVSYQKINADGRLFVPSTMAGSGITSVNISMYDSLTKKVLWTTQASTPGANTNVYNIAATAEGGVAATIRERKMSTPGVPATPLEWVDTFVVINAVGQKVKSVQLTNEDPQGNTYNGSFLAAASNGKVVLVRNMSMETQASWPSVVPAISIGTYDPANDIWSTPVVMKGDVDDPDEPFGYMLDDTRVSLSNDTLPILVRCQYNCANNIRLYPVKMSGLGQSYPRGVVTNRSPRPGSAYIALGDSFSSGEGVPPFEMGTDLLWVNTCHRSTVAYPRLIAGTSGIPALGSDGFRACSGAVTTNITDLGQWDETIQLDWWPDPTTQIVTVTIGGNDIGFAAFGKGCVMPNLTCAIDSPIYNTTLSKINNELPAKLEATYKKVLAHAPNAQIYVVGYPHVAPVKTGSEPRDLRCPYLYDGGTNWANAQGARSIVDKLNARIETEVNDVRAMNAGNTRLHFIDANGAGSPFVGHTLCADPGDSYFINIDQVVVNEAYVFHPNARGQQAYADLVTAALN